MISNKFPFLSYCFLSIKDELVNNIMSFILCGAGSYDLSEKVLNLLNFVELAGALNFLGNNLIYFFSYRKI